MLNGKKKLMEEALKQAFESGYANAASSFSKLTSNKIFYNNFQYGFHELDSVYFKGQNSFERTGTNHLVTTEIFGDFTGKSYFLISEKEFELLTQSVPEGKNLHVNLKEEFIKELDNILSASVITHLSNELTRKMYGDIPIHIGKVTGKIEDIIYDDFNEQAAEVYVNSAFFSFENHPAISPFFIWVIDSHTIKVLEQKPA